MPLRLYSEASGGVASLTAASFNRSFSPSSRARTRRKTRTASGRAQGYLPTVYPPFRPPSTPTLAYRDEAEACRAYAKQAGGTLVMQNRCAEIKVRAERKAGELLRDMPRKGLGRPEQRSDDSTISDPTLADLGVSKDEPSRWQKIAETPEEPFEQHSQGTRAPGGRREICYYVRTHAHARRKTRTASQIDGQ